MSYLHKNKSGTYIFRRGIPESLRPVLGRGREWVESLRTKESALAKGRALEVAARVEEAFQQARRGGGKASPAPEQAMPLPPQIIRQIVQTWKERELYRRAELLAKDPFADGSEWDKEVKLLSHDPFAMEGKSAAERKHSFDVLDECDRRVDAFFDEAAKALGFVIAKSSPSLHIGWHLLRDAWLEVVKEEGRWRNFDYSSLPATPPDPVHPVAGQRKDFEETRGPKLSDALEVWSKGGIARGAKTPRPATAQEARAIARRFIELCGDMPIREITRAQGSRFRDAIASIPARLKPDLAQRPIQELIKMDWSGHALKSATTINKSLTLLSAVMTRAEKDGHFDGLNWRNPFNVSISVDSLDEENYEPFDVNELNALFASPVFSSRERPVRGSKETAKWAPLVALCQGARRSEILQLFVKDVYVHSETGLPVIRFDRDTGKLIKTATSVRTVPVHPKLVDLGFLQFVEGRRRQVGEGGSLWEGFEDRIKIRSTINKWGEWFNGYLRLCRIGGPTKSFQSFRGTFKRFGHDAGVPERILDRLVGHAVSGVGATYGRKRQADGGRDTGISLERFGQEIGRIDFEKVRFDLIK